MATWCRPIATLAYRCSKVSSFTFVICFVSKVMPYFTSTVLCLLISDALIEFHLFDPSRCSVVTFTGCTAIWEALPPTGVFRNCSVWNTELSKIMISNRLKYNIYRYFSSTGIPRIPISHKPLVLCLRPSMCSYDGELFNLDFSVHVLFPSYRDSDLYLPLYDWQTRTVWPKNIKIGSTEEKKTPTSWVPLG